MEKKAGWQEDDLAAKGYFPPNHGYPTPAKKSGESTCDYAIRTLNEGMYPVGMGYPKGGEPVPPELKDKEIKDSYIECLKGGAKINIPENLKNDPDILKAIEYYKQKEKNDMDEFIRQQEEDPWASSRRYR